MLGVSIEPCKMVRYPSYFVEYSMIKLGHIYSFQLRGYDTWEKYIMTLIRFKRIQSAFHPEAGTYFCRDKCHQLCYFIRMFNDKANIIFFIGYNCAFDEGGGSVRIGYCPVRMYNKDKPENIYSGFFILSNAKYYFIYNIYMYQYNNTEKNHIHPSIHNLFTTQKCVANDIINSGIKNNPHGSKHIYIWTINIPIHKYFH